MEEQKPQPTPVQEQPKQPSEDKTTTSLIDKANQAAERLEKANKEQIAILERGEALEARRRLGGETGMTPQEQPKVETPKEYMEKVMKGRL